MYDEKGNGIFHQNIFFRELCEADDEDVVSDDEDEQGNHDNADMPRKKHKNNELSHTPEVDKRIVFIGNLSPGFKFKVQNFSNPSILYMASL